MTPMRLTDLHPRFVRWYDRVEPVTRVHRGWDTATEAGTQLWNDAGRPTETVEAPVTYMETVATLAEAQGVTFLHPEYFQQHGGAVGVTTVQVAFRDRGALDHHGSRGKDGQPSRWAVSGTCFDDLVLSPSIDTHGWHGHVGLNVPGEVTAC